MYKYSKFIPHKTDDFTSKRYFTYKVLYTKTTQSENHKINFLKNLNAKEKSYIVTNSGNNYGDFKYNALLFFIIQKLTNTEEHPTHIVGKLKDKTKKTLSENYLEFINEINDVNALQIDFLVGKDKLKYTMTVDNFLNIITISTSIFHPEEINTTNLLKLISTEINNGIKYLDLIDEIQ